MPKKVQISDDNGSNWYTLPGSQGEFNNEASDSDDTVFGQDYASSQTGIIGWTVSANGYYKGFAGYVATLKKQGTPTAMTAEACTLVSGKTYQITAAAKRLIDRTAAITVLGNAIAISASNIESFDYLFGRVTFISSYTPTTPITITGTYIPLVTVGKANAFTLTQTANAIDTTDFDTAQANSGHRTFIYGLKTVSLELTGIYALANGLKALLTGRTECIIEINPEGSSKAVARGYFKCMNQGQSGDVGALEEEKATFNLSVPSDDKLFRPFGWLFDVTTTLSTAIQKAVNTWLAGTLCDVRYLHDGTNGYTGDAVITDISLSGGIEVMNEFTVNFQGSGTLTSVP